MIIFILLSLTSLSGAELLIAHKGDKSICIGTNGSVPTWILPTENADNFNFSENMKGEWSSDYKNSRINCNFNKENGCDGWNYNKSNIKSTEERQIKGYSWNDLDIYEAKQNITLNIEKCEKVRKDTSYLISILAKDDVSLNLFGNYKNISLMLNDKITLKLDGVTTPCTGSKDKCEQRVQLEEGKMWLDFKLGLSYDNNGYLATIKFHPVADKDTDFKGEWGVRNGNYTDVFNKLRLSSNNNKMGYWKFHQSKALFFRIGQKNTVISKTQLTVDKSDLCIELSYFSEGSDVTFYIKVENEDEKTEKLDDTKNIFDKRICFKNLPLHKQYKIGIKANHIFKFSIFAIRECSNNDYYKLSLNNYKESDLTCVDLQNTKNTVKKKEKKRELLPTNCKNIDMFGLDCYINCNDLFDAEGCKGVTVCNSTTCSCVPGYYGTNCEKKCDKGKYGANCDKDCGNCKSNVQCNYYDGKCPNDECQPGYKTSFCNETCDDGTYGENCKHTCSENCLNKNDCNKTDGECAGGCKDGYSPPDCRDELLQLKNQSFKNETFEDKVVFHITQNDINGSISKLHNISVQCNDKTVIVEFEKQWEKFIINNLNVNTDYNCNVQLIEVNGNKGKNTTITFRRSKKSDNGLIIGGAVAFIILAFILIGVICYYKNPSAVSLKLNRLQQLCQININQDNTEFNGTRNENPVSIPLALSIPKQKIKRSTDHTCRINLNQFKEYVQNSINNDTLKTQHSLFPRGQTQPWIEGKRPEHKGKNRYGNLVAYDSTRVILQKLPNEPHSHYINANYIDGYSKPKEYIATQGPKPQTLEDFWRMIWQENVSLIIMLANLVETGKVKCEKYWPDLNKEMKHGNMSIKTKKEDIFMDYTVRDMSLTKSTTQRKITQLHYTSWPDHGVPRYPHTLAHFLLKIIEHKSPGPIVVHCSAGVGRTGTILLAHSCYKMALEENAIDCLQLIAHMRSQRPNMVDNEHQYILTHKLLVELLLTKNSLISKEEFLIKNRAMTERHFREEFMELHENSNSDVQDLPYPHDSRKDRSPNITAGTEGRVILNKPMDNYINAIYVDGIRKQDQFIITQLPLPHTITDFWSMVVDKASVIIFLNQPDPRDPSTAMLWTERNALHSTDFSVSILEKQPSKKYHDLITLRIQDLEHCLCKDIPVITVKNWNRSELIPSAGSQLIFNLWDEIGKIKVDKSIVVVCHDGCTASGLFVAGIHIIEYLKATNYVNIGHSIRSIRHHRRQLIKSIEQYKFLYGLVSSYFDYFETYADV